MYGRIDRASNCQRGRKARRFTAGGKVKVRPHDREALDGLPNVCGMVAEERAANTDTLPPPLCVFYPKNALPMTTTVEGQKGPFLSLLHAF